MRGFIFGDVGEHAEPFMRSLESIGVDLTSGVIPADVHIAQVGDLIHKGPDSEVIVEVVDRILRRTPERWTQLIGNHEAQHLGLVWNGWESSHCRLAPCSDKTLSTLRRWYDEGLIRLVSGFTGHNDIITVGSETLFVHAGLTQSVWDILGAPGDVAGVMKNVEAVDVRDINQPGVFPMWEPAEVVGKTPGLFWAHSTLELYPSWDIYEMPFNQVHGHTAPYSWRDMDWFHLTDEDWQQRITVYPNLRATVTTTDQGTVFVGVDPSFSNQWHGCKNGQPFMVVDDFKVISP